MLEALDGVRDHLEGIGDELEKDESRRRLLWATRTALIVADSAGSGLFREKKSVKHWIAGAFDSEKRLDGPAIGSIRDGGGQRRVGSPYATPGALPERFFTIPGNAASTA